MGATFFVASGEGVACMESDRIVLSEEGTTGITAEARVNGANTSFLGSGTGPRLGIGPVAVKKWWRAAVTVMKEVPCEKSNCGKGVKLVIIPEYVV